MCGPFPIDILRGCSIKEVGDLLGVNPLSIGSRPSEADDLTILGQELFLQISILNYNMVTIAQQE